MSGVKQIWGVFNGGAVKGLRPVCRGALKDFDLCLMGCKKIMACVHLNQKLLIYYTINTSIHIFLTVNKEEKCTHPKIV